LRWFSETILITGYEDAIMPMTSPKPNCDSSESNGGKFSLKEFFVAPWG
jgi:hypothetical protein